MASKQKERVGEVQRAKGVLYEVSNDKYTLLKQHYTKQELLLLLRTLERSNCFFLLLLMLWMKMVLSL